MGDITEAVPWSKQIICYATNVTSETCIEQTNTDKQVKYVIIYFRSISINDVSKKYINENKYKCLKS